MHALDSGSASSSLRDALARASESENALRVLQQRVSELEAMASSSGVAASTDTDAESAPTGFENSALLERLSSREAEVEALKKCISEAALKEQQLQQQLADSRLAAAESQSALRTRDSDIQSGTFYSPSKDVVILNQQLAESAALISQLQTAQASWDHQVRNLELQAAAIQDKENLILQLRSELKFAEESNRRLQQKNEESLELVASQASQMKILHGRIKAAESIPNPAENRASDYAALLKEKDALGRTVSSLSSELLKIKEQYLQAISKERLNSLGHVAILEQKMQQHKAAAPQSLVESDSSKEVSWSKRFEQQEARVQDLQTALVESSAARKKLESANSSLNRKLKETQDAFKNLVIYCHELETASLFDSAALENEALKLKVSSLWCFFEFLLVSHIHRAFPGLNFIRLKRCRLRFCVS
jgi:hypothetical protein